MQPRRDLDPAWLRSYHAQPGRTAAMLQGWRTQEGHSSYHVLVTRTDGIDRSTRALDLGCGDGLLLQQLVDAGFTRLCGLDMSAHELAAARARLPDQVELVIGDARSTEFGDDTIGLVVCHMCLRIMGPIDELLDELARIMGPGGVFVAVLGRPARDPAFDRFRRELSRAYAEAGAIRLSADERLSTAVGLDELLARHRFEDRRIVDFEVQTRATPQQLWAMLGLGYDVHLLPTASQVELGRRLRAQWAALTGEDKRLDCTLGMRALSCRLGQRC